MFAPADSDGGVDLYLAFARPAPPAALAPLAADDSRWSQVAAIIDDADPRGVVRGWALYEGAFEQATGEVGPTGKPRGWRIEELRTGDLCARTSPQRSSREIKTSPRESGARSAAEGRRERGTAPQ